MDGRVKIVLGARSTIDRIEVDNVDVTEYCAGVNLSASKGNRPLVMLTLTPWVVDIRGDADVVAKMLEDGPSAEGEA